MPCAHLNLQQRSEGRGFESLFFMDAFLESLNLPTIIRDCQVKSSLRRIKMFNTKVTRLSFQLKIRVVLDVRHFDIRRFSFTSLVNCYPNFDTSHETDVQYRGISGGDRFFRQPSLFRSSMKVDFDICSILTGTTRDRYQGLPVQML